MAYSLPLMGHEEMKSGTLIVIYHYDKNYSSYASYLWISFKLYFLITMSS